MLIEFPPHQVVDLSYVSFPAKIGEVTIVCKVSDEALQDINPEECYLPLLQLFEFNRSTIENIAHTKIEENEFIAPNIVFISKKDI